MSFTYVISNSGPNLYLAPFALASLIPERINNMCTYHNVSYQGLYAYMHTKYRAYTDYHHRDQT